MIAHLITDCADMADIGRVHGNLVRHLGGSPSFSWAPVYHTLTAGGELVDMLDATRGAEGFILVNRAPREGEAKKHANGTPFCYFQIGKTWVLASVDGYTLSMAKKLGLLNGVVIRVMDTKQVLLEMAKRGKIETEEAHRVASSQFRSFTFLPLVAGWLHAGEEVPGTVMALDEILDVAHSIWRIDNFGNCKTTVLSDELNFAPGSNLQTNMGLLPCYVQLRDVPDHTAALTIGSSGFGNRRFVELVVQGVDKGSAQKHFDLQVGQEFTATV